MLVAGCGGSFRRAGGLTGSGPMSEGWVCLDCGEPKVVGEMATVVPDMVAEGSGASVGSCRECSRWEADSE